MEHKYFRNPVTGGVHAFAADGSEDAFILEGLVPMTEAERAAHLAANMATPEQLRRAELLAELAAIDAASARPLRAILVGSATDADRVRLTELDEQAAALRAELAGLEPPPAA